MLTWLDVKTHLFPAVLQVRRGGVQSMAKCVLRMAPPSSRPDRPAHAPPPHSMQGTMMRKYGPDKLQDHFIVMDTICDATQVRAP